jgi:thioredoxin-like negative regulator of GroEL
LLGGGDLLVPLVCLSSLNAVTGGATRSDRILRALWPQVRSQPVAVQSWMQGIMADTAKYLGNDAEADRHFRTALQLTPGDNFLLADYADFLLDQHRPRAALDLVKDYPSSDTSFLRQVYAEAVLNSPRKEADLTQMARRFAAIDQRGSPTYRREEAGFALYMQHDPRRALQLAQENWTVQRAPEDMRVLLAAAIAAQHPEAAQPVLDQLASSRFQYEVVVKLAARVREALANEQVARIAGAPTLAPSMTRQAERAVSVPSKSPAQ